MRRSLFALVLAIVCAAGVSGCGDDEDVDGESQTTSTTAAVTGTTGAAGTGAKGGRFCELFRSYNDKFSRTTTVKDAGQLRDLLRSARSDVDEAKGLAPPEIKADTEVVAGVIDEYVDALEGVDYNASRIPANIPQRLISADFLGAAQRTQTYVTANC